MKRDNRIMEEAELLQLEIERSTEEFLCQLHGDSEWRVYEYDTDGAHRTVVYEVTDETPPDRSVVLKRYDNGDEFIITWNVTVSKRA